MHAVFRTSSFLGATRPAVRAALASSALSSSFTVRAATRPAIFTPAMNAARQATQPSILLRRSLSDVASEASAAAKPSLEEVYAKPLRILHWVIGGGIIGTFAFVQAAQNTKGETKGTMMMLHKSTGLLVATLIPLRILTRLVSRVPPPLPGHSLEVLAGKVSHYLMYAFMIILPATGITMGIAGGKGIPFYGIYTIPGNSTPNGDVAKQAFKVHKQAGQIFEYFVPLHAGAAFYHLAKGQSIFRRVNPFLKEASKTAK